MSGFDVEWYLRRWGEDTLGADATDLTIRARALVEVRAISADLAARILEDYRHARFIRGRASGDHRSSASQRPVPVDWRVCACELTLEPGWGTVLLRYVMLSAARIRLGATVTFGEGGAPPRIGPNALRPWRPRGPLPIELVDDRGRVFSADFSGGGSAREWNGYYEAAPGPVPATAWIDVAGERVELRDITPIAAVALARFDDLDEPACERAARYLDHLSDAQEPVARRIAMEAFLACGLVTPESVLRVDPVPDRPVAYGGARGRVSAEAQQRAPSGPGGRRVLIGVSTPVFDGICLTVVELVIAADGFEVDFTGQGPLARLDPTPSLDRPTLGFTALDDCGTEYVGTLRELSGGRGDLHGRVGFTPALGDRVSELVVTFGTATAQAVVSIALDRGAP